ncbi:MAG TPA: glycosyltransferase [Polyangiaceae bacterium]|nr:glycosyltransferase [Polyangiaceae bacterium]
MTRAPEVSVVIPVYNEAAFLGGAVAELCARLPSLGRTYEIVLAENGSTDATAAIARALARERPALRALSVPGPDYGRALREGILAARGEYVLCDEIDIGDLDFHRRALALLEAGAADFVVGSKLLADSRDERPLFRHAASLVYSGLLRLALGFRGTDTHGLKAFRRDAVGPVVRACRLSRDVFASELVLRAERAGLRVVETPVRLREKRPPSIRLLKRVPAVLRQVALLAIMLRLEGRPRGRP